jgi:hypothetical protein
MIQVSTFVWATSKAIQYILRQSPALQEWCNNALHKNQLTSFEEVGVLDVLPFKLWCGLWAAQ